METRLEHARANVSDLGVAIDWYTRVLGFVVDATWPPGDPESAHFRAASGAVFAVQVADGRGGRFNFTVDDPDALRTRLPTDVTVIEPLCTTDPRDEEVHDRRSRRQRDRVRRSRRLSDGRPHRPRWCG